jgi:hypothetical protein
MAQAVVQEAVGRREKAGSRRQEAGGRRQAAGGRRQEQEEDFPFLIYHFSSDIY